MNPSVLVSDSSRNFLLRLLSFYILSLAYFCLFSPIVFFASCFKALVVARVAVTAPGAASANPQTRSVRRCRHPA